MNIDVISLLTYLDGNEPFQTTVILVMGAVVIYSKGVRDKLLQLHQGLSSLLDRVLRHSFKQ